MTSKMTRSLALGSLALLITLYLVLTLQSVSTGELTSTENLTPHGYCIQWIPGLVRTYAISDLLIALSYMAISIILGYLIYRARRDIPYYWVFGMFGIFIFSCGVTHFMDVITLWTPSFWQAAFAKVVTAMASVTTAVVLPPLTPGVLTLVKNARLSEARRRQIIAANAELKAEIERRNQVEAELRAALEREHQLNEFRANLVRRLSHEFRTPMAIALTSSDLLKRYEDRMNEEQRLSHLDRIQNEIIHLNHLLDDIVTISKLESYGNKFLPEPINLPETCADIVHEVEDASGGTHTITQDVEGDFSDARVDIELLERILRHLLLNAVKYSLPGAPVIFQLRRSGDEALIEIRDQGMGIPKVDQGHVFEAFYRGGNADDISGNGIGLAIVKQAVELHRGTIHFVSDEGKGTTFYICLPLNLTP
jgi:signal transduction histidine kinase